MSAGRAAKPKRRKTTEKSTVAKVPQPHGGALNAGGTPGNKGGTGRPPNEFKDFLAKLLDDPKVRDSVEQILRDKDHKAFSTVYGDTVDRVHGKAKQPLEHTMSASMEELLAGSRRNDG